MVNNIMIKNNSFIQSMHNNIQCLSLDTAVRPCDRCWSYCWLTRNNQQYY